MFGDRGAVLKYRIGHNSLGMCWRDLPCLGTYWNQLNRECL
jgi:hypothetical protein